MARLVQQCGVARSQKIKLQGTLLDDSRIDSGEFRPGSIGR
jgi:hypothetical protein